MEEIEEGSMITVTKYIYDNPAISSVVSLNVMASHMESGLFCAASRDVGDCPIDLLDNLDTTDWSHPLLAEMRHEALQILVDKAEQAQSIQYEAFGILSDRDAA